MKHTAQTIRQVLKAYLLEHVDHKVVARRRQENCIDVLSAELGHLPPSGLTHEVIMRYRSRRASGKTNGRRVGDGTLRRELNCLVAALNHAARHRRIDQSMIPHIDLPKAPPPRDMWLNEQEADQLWDAARAEGGRAFLFVAIAIETASRRRAIETLRWDQVDLQCGLINFQASGLEITKKKRVPVPMSTRLHKVLSEARSSSENEWVIGSPHPIQRCFDRVKRRAHEATGNRRFMAISPHTLRHTWATLAARAGVPLFEIAGVLGDSVATTTRVYAHHSPDHLRSAVNFRSQRSGQALALHVDEGQQV